MKTRLLSFFRQNWIGTISCVSYCGVSFLLFFFGLAYGASCPESGPEVCDTFLQSITPVLRVISIVPIAIWGIIFYSGQQIMVLSGITTPSEYSSSFFAINVLPGISFTVTLFVWALIGGFVQNIYRKIRK